MAYYKVLAFNTIMVSVCILVTIKLILKVKEQVLA